MIFTDQLFRRRAAAEFSRGVSTHGKDAHKFRVVSAAPE